MATHNLFELLGDEETDASAVIERAAAKKKQEQQEQTQLRQHQEPPKLPSKPLPPAQAVRELKAGQKEIGRGRGGRGRGYGNRDKDFNGGFTNRDKDLNGGSNFTPQEGGFQRNRNFDRSEGYRREGDGFQGNRGRFYGQGRPAPTSAEDGEAEHNLEGGRGGGRFRGTGRRQGRPFGGNIGGFGEGQQQRAYVRKDAVGGLQEAEDKPLNREAGDAIETEGEKHSVTDNKQPVDEPNEPKTETGAVEEKKEQEEEDKEMLLDDYYKALDEKTKHLKPQKSEARKVVIDRDFENMTMVERKHDEGDFVKLGSEKDKGKRKEVASNKDEKVRKNVSINEFLKPAEGEYYSGNRRGRGGGRGRGEGFRGGIGGNYNSSRQSTTPRIEDPSQFPTLGGA